METTVLNPTARYTVLRYAAADAQSVAATKTLAEKFIAPAQLSPPAPKVGSKIDLTPRVSAISFTENSQLDGGGAAITLIMYPEEYGRYATSALPVNIGNGRIDFRRILRLGDWIHIKRDTSTVFVGVLTALNTQQSVDSNGQPQTIVELGCSNFMYLFMMSQLRMTPVGDNLKGAPQITDILTSLDPGAIAQYGDYRTGFLKSVLSALQTNEISSAVFLQRVITALGHYKLPAELGGGELGSNIVVLDGGSADFSTLPPGARLGVGNDADVIRSAMVTKFRAMLMSNMTHAEIISSIFTPLLQMMELFPIVLPARRTPTRAIERTAGICLALIYRFKPCTPQHGPSVSTYTAQALRRGTRSTSGAQTVRPGGSSFCAAYFGPTVVSGSYFYRLDKRNVASINMALQDSEHFNAVFLEQPWGSGDAHNGTLIRANAPLVCDVEDINKYGLRCLSTAHPFISTAKSSARQRIDWELSGRAVPERLFHTVGMNNQFFNGQIILFQADTNLRAGMWVQIADRSFLGFELPLTHEDSMLCYITAVSTSIVVDENGIAAEQQELQFIRGSYGVNIPVPHTLDGPNSSVANLRATEDTDWEVI